jgi:hypothetical protein
MTHFCDNGDEIYVCIIGNLLITWINIYSSRMILYYGDGCSSKDSLFHRKANEGHD